MTVISILSLPYVFLFACSQLECILLAVQETKIGIHALQEMHIVGQNSIIDVGDVLAYVQQQQTKYQRSEQVWSLLLQGNC